MHRSSSVDNLGRERFSSRWSRENTPIDCTDKYERHVRRSFTPIRDISGYQVVKDNSYTGEYRQPLGVITTPYHTNYNYYSENQPIRKYDVFQVRTWAYPIYKYIHGRDFHPGRPYSYTRKYATTSHYTPPTMAPEVKSLTSRRGYSGYNYVASEQNFDVASKPWSLSNYRFWRSHVTTAPWYWSYYGRSGGRSGNRHYNSYHPPAYTSRLSTYWPSYY
uniref:Uncharacterized protein n=1 Tax=Acrobeloides nanus TaxID=290746 RepID=A0A914C400_9BILA